MNRIQKAFSPVRAETELKEKTVEFLHNQAARKSGAVKRFRVYATACAALVVLVTGIIFYGIYTTPVSYISIDVNPSVELELNLFDRVIAWNGYNDDGEAIAQQIDLYNMPYTEAVDTLLQDSQMEQCLAKEGAQLVFTVSSDKEAELTAGIESCQGYILHQGTCTSAGTEEVHEAHELGLSMGRYQVYLKLQQAGIEITPEECQNLTMRELMDLLEETPPSDSGESASSSFSSSASSTTASSSSSHHGEENGHGNGDGDGDGHQWGKHSSSGHE